MFGPHLHARGLPGRVFIGYETCIDSNEWWRGGEEDGDQEEDDRDQEEEDRTQEEDSAQEEGEERTSVCIQ